MMNRSDTTCSKLNNQCAADQPSVAERTSALHEGSGEQSKFRRRIAPVVLCVATALSSVGVVGVTATTAHANDGGAGAEITSNLAENRPAVWPELEHSSHGQQIVFSTSYDGQVYERVQSSPNGGWAIAKSLGQPSGRAIASQPSVVSEARGNESLLHVFVISEAGTLFDISQTKADPNGGFFCSSGNHCDLTKDEGHWTNFGNVELHGWTGTPLALNNSDGRLQVFARNDDGEIYSAWRRTNGRWTSWYPFGGSAASSPSGMRDMHGRLHLFIVGKDHGLWTKSQTAPNSGWTTWSRISNPSATNSRWSASLIGRPTIAENYNRRLQVFVLGADKSLYSLYEVTDTFTTYQLGNWTKFSGTWTSDVSAAQDQSQRLTVFARGIDGRIYSTRQTAANGGSSGLGGPWTNWQVIPGGAVAGQPAVGQNGDGRLQVYAAGYDSQIYTVWTRPDLGWSNWYDFGFASRV